MSARIIQPGENFLQQSDTSLAFSGRSGRESRFHSRLSDVNDDMWAHRSKTTEESRGCRRCDSVHPSIPHGRELFERAKPGRAYNIPSGTSFALLMARAVRPRRVAGRRDRISRPETRRRSSNASALASHRSYRSYRPTKSAMTPLSGRVLTPS